MHLVAEHVRLQSTAGRSCQVMPAHPIHAHAAMPVAYAPATRAVYSLPGQDPASHKLKLWAPGKIVRMPRTRKPQPCILLVR